MNNNDTIYLNETKTTNASEQYLGSLLVAMLLLSGVFILIQIYATCCRKEHRIEGLTELSGSYTEMHRKEGIVELGDGRTVDISVADPRNDMLPLSKRDQATAEARATYEL